MSWFRFFRALFRPEGDHRALYERLHEMLQLGRRMFDLATAPLFEPGVQTTDHATMHEMDAQVNRLEREARRRLLTALAVNPEQDAPTRLLLLGLLKDAERCGDFAKNTFEVFERSGPLPPGPYADLLRDQRQFVLRLFEEVWTVYENGDRERALALIAEAKTFSKRDGEIVAELISGAPAANPAAVALLTRFFKRIQQHLVHILRSVALPEEEAAQSGGPRG